MTVLSVVIPAYNEEKSISEQIKNVKAVMDKTDWIYDLIVVDDGSTDGTAEVAGREKVELIRMPRNCGYGAALKAGIAAASAQAREKTAASRNLAAHQAPVPRAHSA